MKKIKQWFQDIPISKKLRLIITITACIALLMEFCISAISNWVMQRQTTVGNLTAQARIIGANSTAALTFNDPKAAEENIGVLRAVPSVEYGVLFSRDGRVFAKYISGGSKSYLLPGNPLADGYYFEHGHLAVSRNIFLDNEHIGSIVIRSDLRDMYSQLIRNIIIAASITIFAAIIVFLLSSVFQRTISRSLLHLSQLMKDIARTKDYTVRALKYGQDEIGQLVDSFNIMTEDLQKTTVSRDYVDSIIRNMVDSLIVSGPDGTIERVNRAACNLLGYREEELVGRPLSMIFREELSPKGLEKTENMETDYISKDGKEIPVLFSSSAMKDDAGSVQGIVCVASNITERKLYEKEKETMQLKMLTTSKLASLGERGGRVCLDNQKWFLSDKLPLLMPLPAV